VEAWRERWGQRWAVDVAVCGEGSDSSVAAVATVVESGGGRRGLKRERGSCGTHFGPFQRPLATGGFLQIFKAAYYRGFIRGLRWRRKIEPGLLKIVSGPVWRPALELLSPQSLLGLNSKTFSTLWCSLIYMIF
jgi:hypothetical protein